MWECAAEADVDDVFAEMMKKTPGVIVFYRANVRGGYVTLNDVQGEIEVMRQPFASGRFDRKRFQLPGRRRSICALEWPETLIKS